MATYLSKTTYLAGIQCVKRLWLEVHQPQKATPTSPSQQYQLEQGTQVGRLARDRYPDGVLITGEASDLEQRLAETKTVIAGGATTIFEAAFLSNQTYILADIISRSANSKKDDGAWNLYEVKASTEVKDIHLPDLAIQKFVIENAGTKVVETFVMHLDRNYIYSDRDLSQLFSIEDVTEAVDALLPTIAENLQRFLSVVHTADEPDITIGPHCTDPYPCPFKEYCWQPYGDRTVFDIPRLSRAKQSQLRDQGILLLEQLPKEFSLSANQRTYVERILGNQVEIDEAGIREQLATLVYPLHFFDFETDNAAIPRFDETRPYQQIPFQFSCHTMTKEGALSHTEYLHEEDSDPRPNMIKFLLANVAETGSVIVYNASFERRVLQELAINYPQYAQPLQSIADRLWDQLDIFRKQYKHAGFGNSDSIKHVLPVLVPQLTYDTLDIQNGADAQAKWNILIRTKDEQVKTKLATELREYCALDTLAMVEIHKVLQQSNGEGKSNNGI